ncbi:MAG TPA: DUF4238 domain-containing protein [Acidiferrobacteraceae bacterium]|nr:DUF4238 domain-containing protein [Acidiferrobacteraceae bacterium]
MATANREHHFVPQFYLRYFSDDGMRINLFNFARDKVISNASIKHQCSKHKFYDFAPELEQAFSGLEGEAAGVIRNIQSSGVLPTHGSHEWLSLLGFIIFQKLRTTSMGHKHDAMTDYFAKLWLENNPKFDHIDPDSFEMRNIYPVAIPLSIAGEMIPVAEDLRMHLMDNCTSLEYITSDDPVVAHNHYCEGIDYRGVTGWNCCGLQVFWPISPTKLLLLFDPAVYKVGSSHKRKAVTNITNEHDISQLNSLQILNARNNIYFAGTHPQNKTIKQCRNLSSKRPNERMTFVETEGVEIGNGETSSLLHSYEPLLPLKLSVSSITIRKRARKIPLHTRSAMNRKPIERSEEERAAYGLMPSRRYPVKKITRK